MRDELDPLKAGNAISEPQKPQQQNVSLVQTDGQKPKIGRTLPTILESMVQPDTIGGDLCRYFVFPAIEQGLHKVASVLIGHYILGQPIKPSGQKSNGAYTYIYTDKNGYTDYAGVSTGRTQATIIDSNGVSHVISNKDYRGNTQSIFKLQHYADDDILKTTPLPWSWADVEAKREHMNDELAEAIYNSQWASVQDVFDAAGLSGAPPGALKWGWKSISQMSVQLDPDDNTIMIIRMGSAPKQIT